MSPLNGRGVFSKVLLLKTMLKVIFLPKRPVFTYELDYAATC